MNNVFVYCEMEGKHVADVSLELLTKGRKLADELGCQLEAICAGSDLADVEKQVLPYGVDRVHVFDAPGLFPYTSLPHTSILVNLFKEEKPQICLMGATVIGRDLGPRVSSALTSGLTADCTQLEIGSHEDKKNGITYENLLYQIRPAFGGNIVATIVNPEHRPQMATVREGVMKKEIVNENYQGEVIRHDVAKYVPETDYVVKVIDRHVEKAKHNLKGAPADTEWAAKRGLTCCMSWRKSFTPKWVQAVPQWMPGSANTTGRLDRPASPFIRSCISLAAFRDRYSILPECRMRALSSQ